jgi:hypothetical protein
MQDRRWNRAGWSAVHDVHDLRDPYVDSRQPAAAVAKACGRALFLAAVSRVSPRYANTTSPQRGRRHDS